jgi:TRAP-type C4-dicarboxylate transport system substrate-binding protein
MNKDKWNALPPDIQKIIRQINIEWADKHGKAWEESDQVGLKYFIDQGNEVIEQDAKEAERWKQAVAPIIDGYISKLNEKGFNGKEIVDFITTTLNDLQ